MKKTVLGSVFDFSSPNKGKMSIGSGGGYQDLEPKFARYAFFDQEYDTHRVTDESVRKPNKP